VNQQGLGSLITGYIDSTSLAQSRIRNVNREGNSGFAFSRTGLKHLRKTGIAYLAVFAG
jgi:hypothetical protein